MVFPCERIATLKGCKASLLCNIRLKVLFKSNSRDGCKASCERQMSVPQRMWGYSYCTQFCTLQTRFIPQWKICRLSTVTSGIMCWSCTKPLLCLIRGHWSHAYITPPPIPKKIKCLGTDIIIPWLFLTNYRVIVWVLSDSPTHSIVPIVSKLGF